MSNPLNPQSAPPDVLLAFLRLLQLSDSAAPIGSAAHSFGLETLIEEGYVRPDNLYSYLIAQLEEALRLDGYFCALAHRLARVAPENADGSWRCLNAELTAWKLAEETRNASLTLGKRYLRMVESVDPSVIPPSAEMEEAHLASAFGWCAARFGLAEGLAVAAYLHQSITGMVLACQRLMPLGQAQAARMLWILKQPIAEAAEAVAQPRAFSILSELASMRHVFQYSRLFIS